MDRPPLPQSFEAAVEAANRANDEILEGRAAALRALYTHRPDASLLGGFGGFERGWDAIGPRLDWVAEGFAGGDCRYERLTAGAGADVGFVVQLERGEARLAGRAETLRIDFRVTMVFRREEDGWRLVHRHADPGIEKRRPDSDAAATRAS